MKLVCRVCKRIGNKCGRQRFALTSMVNVWFGFVLIQNISGLRQTDSKLPKVFNKNKYSFNTGLISKQKIELEASELDSWNSQIGIQVTFFASPLSQFSSEGHKINWIHTKGSIIHFNCACKINKRKITSIRVTWMNITRKTFLFVEKQDFSF